MDGRRLTVGERADRQLFWIPPIAMGPVSGRSPKCVRFLSPAEIVEELMETLKFDHHVFRPAPVPGADAIDAMPDPPGVPS